MTMWGSTITASENKHGRIKKWGYESWILCKSSWVYASNVSRVLANTHIYMWIMRVKYSVLLVITCLGYARNMNNASNTRYYLQRMQIMQYLLEY